MRVLTIRIELENDAFANGMDKIGTSEVLMDFMQTGRLGQCLTVDGSMSILLRDVNGNTCGGAIVITEAE